MWEKSRLESVAGEVTPSSRVPGMAPRLAT
jgi:hypothetical protein